MKDLSTLIPSELHVTADNNGEYVDSAEHLELAPSLLSPPAGYSLHKRPMGVALNAVFSNALSSFLETSNMSKLHLCDIEKDCARFFGVMQNAGATDMATLPYTGMRSYALNLQAKYAKVTVRGMLSNVRALLKHEASENHTSWGRVWYLSVFTKAPAYVSCIDPIDCAIPDSLAVKSPNASRVLSLSQGLIQKLQEWGYAESSILLDKRVLRLYYIHLDANGMSHTLNYAMSWLENMRDAFGVTWPQAKLVLTQLDDFVNDEDKFHVRVSYKCFGDPVEQLPIWCQDPVNGFLSSRTELPRDVATVQGDRFACVNFCRFLCRRNVTNFGEMTPTLVKEWHVSNADFSDSTLAGYTHSVRYFLQYLEANGACPKKLSLALPRKRANSEHIITILTPEEQQRIQSFAEHAESAADLRDSAIVLLGVKMGLRSSDVVRLKLTDIDWTTQTVTFRQKKTGVGVKLPMPISVGNALYRYLKYGRPRNTNHPEIFLGVHAPFAPLTSTMCNHSLHRALADSSREHGFHICRRTFATTCLRNGTGLTEIAESLGHTGKDAIKHYLSLDEERMLLCPLSLEDFGIRMHWEEPHND